MWTVCFHNPLPFVSLIEIPATPHYRAATASPGACRASWRGEHPLGTVPTQTGISQGMGDWRVPKSPQQRSGGCTLGRASIIHCLLFINNLPPSQHTHTFFPSSLPHIRIYISLFFGEVGGSHAIFYCIDILGLLHSACEWCERRWWDVTATPERLLV